MKKLAFLAWMLFAMDGFLFGFDGLYMGGSIGGTILHGHQRGGAVGSLGGGTVNAYSMDLPADLYTQDFSGMVYLGLGHRWHRLYLGHEIFGQYSHSQAKAAHQNSLALPIDSAVEAIFDKTDVSISPWRYGFDFKPGFVIGFRTLAYARVGIERVGVTLKTKSSNSGDLGPGIGDEFSFPFNSSTSKRISVLRLGGGLEQHISSRLSLRADYTYCNYGHLSLEGSNSGVTAGTPFFFFNAKDTHLCSHSLMLGLSYYFCSDPCLAFTPLNFCEAHFCGFYAGLGGGVSMTASQYNTDLVNISPGPGSGELGVRNNPTNDNLVKGQGRGIGYAGYSVQYYLLHIPLMTALEVFGQYAPYSRTYSDARIFNGGFGNPDLFTARTFSRKKAEISPWQYGVDFRAGFILSPRTVLYGTVGTSVAKLRASIDSQFVGNTGAIPLSLSTHTTRAVLRLGAGAEFALPKGWHLRTDYRYTNYRKVHLDGAQSAVLPTVGEASLSVDASIHPKDHAVTLSISRYF